MWRLYPILTDVVRLEYLERGVGALDNSEGRSSRKEVFQPHLPVRLPCYDLALVTDLALGRSLR